MKLMKMVLVCHLQHAVALLLYASLTTDVKLTERLFWTTTQMKRVYWPVRREAPWSVWRSISPRPGGQTLQTLSGVRYETARPLDQPKHTTDGINRATREETSVCVTCKEAKLTLLRDPAEVPQEGFEFLLLCPGRTFKQPTKHTPGSYFIMTVTVCVFRDRRAPIADVKPGIYIHVSHHVTHAW